MCSIDGFCRQDVTLGGDPGMLSAVADRMVA